MPCEWNPDETGFVSLDEMAANSGCPLPKDVAGFFIGASIVDKHGHPLDGDHDPKGANGCDHRDTPEWKAEHNVSHRHTKHKENPPMSDIVTPAPEEHHVEAAAPQLPAAPQATATVGVDAAVAQVKSLVPHDASPGLLVGGAAALAVIGAAIKFGPQALKNRAEAAEREHEREMRRLELEEKKAQQNDDQHGKCSVERAALEAKVAALESSLSGMAAKVEEAAKAAGEKPAAVGNFDPEDLEERLAMLEKALKPQRKKKGKK